MKYFKTVAITSGSMHAGKTCALAKTNQKSMQQESQRFEAG